MESQRWIPIQNLSTAFNEAHRVLAAVPADKWSAQSPCSEWDARGVAKHMIGGAEMVAACVAGKAFVPTEIDDAADLPATFRDAADAALAAFTSDQSALGRMIKMPFGEMPGATVAGIFTNDEFAHAWDVAKATGMNTDLNPQLATGCLEAAKQFIGPELRMPGLFAAEVEAPPGASAADRLAAFMGRSV